MTERQDGRALRIVIVDDQALVRAGLRPLAESDGDIVVVGEADNGESGVERVRELRPDVALMDIRMPNVNGIEATRAIVADAALNGVRVLVLTTFDEDGHVFEAISAGAAGYLLKDVSPHGLRAAIRVVAAGESLLSPAVTARVMRAAKHRPGTPDTSPLKPLSEREVEVLRLIGCGRTNGEIAAELFLSPATTRTYASRLLTKMQARDRAALVILAYETGLVAPGETP